MLEKIEKLQLLTTGIIISLVVLIAVKMISSSISQNVITTTGSAYEIVKSDSGTINFEITAKAQTKQQAHKIIQNNLAEVKKYLNDKKITDIEAKASNGYYSYKRDYRGMDTNVVDYYNMSQPVTIRDNNVELIKEISTDITGLINKGIDINVWDVSYQYSKLGDLKVTLLEKAATDAKNRAQSMLKPTGSSVGKVKSIRMGVYQITPVDSTNVSDGGINDTSSIDKKVTAVANVAFKIK